MLITCEEWLFLAPPRLPQVAIGESTCAARFFTRPINHGGSALLEIGELSAVALERCDSARYVP